MLPPTEEQAAPRLRDQHDYLRLLAARISGTAANQMLMVALGWQVYDITSSPWALGFVGLAQFLPALLFTLPAGHLVDRHDRRWMLVASLLLQAAVALVLASGSAPAAGSTPTGSWRPRCCWASPVRCRCRPCRR